MKATPFLLASACLLAACQGTSALCIDNVLCTTNAHWDPNKCMCVVDSDASICVQNVQCTAQAHWDAMCCACVVNPGPDAGCVQNVFCSDGAHWDPIACMCVVGQPSDMAQNCSTSCAGGTSGCASMCTGCNSNQLCCPWAGGVCIPTDAGCQGGGGFNCATPTPAGLCPNQCFP